LPYLIDEARDTCKQEALHTNLELVIHLRSGDLLNRTTGSHGKARFAPCSFFNVLIEQEIKFERVRVITEPDLQHPCLKYFAKRKEVTVQSKSLAADACALMNADYLGFGAESTFSAGLSLFNQNHVTVYDSRSINCQHDDGVHDCPFGKTVRYCIPDDNVTRTGSDKMDWLLGYPKRKITKDGEECFE